MNLDLLLPRVIAWAEAQASVALLTGAALNRDAIEVARRVGVQHPERIRISTVAVLPFPEDPDLRAAASEVGLLGPDAEGLTLGYAVFVRRGSHSSRLLSHEFRHVYQYEVNGGIAGFLPVYLRQLVEYGYQNSPLEVDARSCEQV